MKTEKPSVIIIDDEKNILKTMDICFKEMGFQSELYYEPLKAIEAIQNKSFDLAFVDLKMSPVDGMEVLKEIRYCSPSTTVIIMTAHGSIENAVQAIKMGAYNYLQKPFDYLELELLAGKVLEYHNLKTELAELKTTLSSANFPGNIITRNDKMREMVELAEKVADSKLSVLIEGESGTGKELFANLIHQKSSRVKHPFVKINCAALSPTLLESELFGHIKGAFSGAVNDRQGRFEFADGGTVFLDEIAEISADLQAKLLRVLQSGEFERVGESKTRKVDIRVIAATNKDLDEAIKEGIFRDDLFYRLNAMRIKLSPLRERREDIPLLINYFIKEKSSGRAAILSEEAMKAMRTYNWPGNVRELQNVIERIAVLSNNDVIDVSVLPEEIKNIDWTREPASLEEIEKNHIKKVLHYAKDLADASNILGIDPATLYRKRKKYNL